MKHLDIKKFSSMNNEMFNGVIRKVPVQLSFFDRQINSYSQINKKIMMIIIKKEKKVMIMAMDNEKKPIIVILPDKNTSWTVQNKVYCTFIDQKNNIFLILFPTEKEAQIFTLYALLSKCEFLSMENIIKGSSTIDLPINTIFLKCVVTVFDICADSKQVIYESNDTYINPMDLKIENNISLDSTYIVNTSENIYMLLTVIGYCANSPDGMEKPDTNVSDVSSDIMSEKSSRELDVPMSEDFNITDHGTQVNDHDSLKEYETFVYPGNIKGSNKEVEEILYENSNSSDNIRKYSDEEVIIKHNKEVKEISNDKENEILDQEAKTNQMEEHIRILGEDMIDFRKESTHILHEKKPVEKIDSRKSKNDEKLTKKESMYYPNKFIYIKNDTNNCIPALENIGFDQARLMFNRRLDILTSIYKNLIQENDSPNICLSSDLLREAVRNIVYDKKMKRDILHQKQTLIDFLTDNINNEYEKSKLSEEIEKSIRLNESMKSEEHDLRSTLLNKSSEIQLLYNDMESSMQESSLQSLKNENKVKLDALSAELTSNNTLFEEELKSLQNKHFELESRLNELENERINYEKLYDPTIESKFRDIKCELWKVVDEKLENLKNRIQDGSIFQFSPLNDYRGDVLLEKVQSLLIQELNNS